MKHCIVFWYFQEFRDIINDERDVDSVVVGLAPSKFNHENLSAAFQVIKNKDTPLIAINKSRYFASKEGLKLGTGNFQILVLFYIAIIIFLMWCTHLTYYDNFAGCFVAGLEYSADVTAEVIGKPEKAFFDAALNHLNSITQSTKTNDTIKKEGTASIGYLSF